MIRTVTIEEFLHPISTHVAPLFAFEGQHAYVGGTAVIIAPRIAVTAHHVWQAIYDHFGQTTNLDIYIFQSNTGACWYVANVSSWVGTDITVLSLRPRNEIARTSEVGRLSMAVNPPSIDTRVAAIGYPSTQLNIVRNDIDVLQLQLTIEPTVSEGKVLEIHHTHRDLGLLRFPSFSVEAESRRGMSGGAVFNEKRELCGLVCSGGEGELSNYFDAVSIWPMATIPVRIPEDTPSHPGISPGATYKILELAQLGYITLNGHEQIEFFKHENGSDGVRRYHNAPQSP